MYLALEVDDSKQAIAASEKAEAIDRALKTVRSRIEGYRRFRVGRAEAGQRPDRRPDSRASRIPSARESSSRSRPFLEFKITDKTQALERALAALDQMIKQRGSSPRSAATRPPRRRRPSPRGFRDFSTRLTRAEGRLVARRLRRAKGARRTRPPRPIRSSSQPGGAFSSLLQQGSMPGEFYVAMDKIPTLQTLLGRLRGRRRRFRRARISSPERTRVSLQGKLVQRLLPRRRQADHHGRLHQDARPTRTRSTAPSSSSR